MCITIPWSVATITGSDEISLTIWKYYDVSEGLFIHYSAVKWPLGPSSFKDCLAASVGGSILPVEKR